jgi:hypothetical protein
MGGRVNILDAILGAESGAPVRHIGARFGLRHDQATTAISALVPEIAAGLQRTIGSEGGLDGLMAALSGGGHSRYLDDPPSLKRERAVQDGLGILSHILGGNGVRRQVAARASSRTGIDTGLLEQLLPLVAALAMGVLARRANRRGSGMLPGQPTAGIGLLSMLSPVLDRQYASRQDDCPA